MIKIEEIENVEDCGKHFEARTVVTQFYSKECGHKADNARKKAGKKEAKKKELIAQIPNNRPYISISEAVSDNTDFENELLLQKRKEKILVSIRFLEEKM